MKEKKVSRQSNYELMRIISMLFIVLYHILIHGKILEHATGTMEILLVLIESIIIVHVNSFILASGYFQCKSTMKVGKAISINNMVWFYKVTIMLILVVGGVIALPDTVTQIQTYLPLDYGTYWFMGSYLVLYLISPILNKIINNSNKKELKQILVLLFLIISVLSTVSKDVFFNTVTGRSLGTFILLYFIGAYIRNYPIDTSYFMKPFSKKARRVIYLFIGLFCSVLSTFCWLAYTNFVPLGSVTRELGTILGQFHISYASPIIIIQSVAYFLFFGTFDFKNKWINKISACTLAVYLISENIYVRQIMYDKIGLTKIQTITPMLLFQILLLVVVIFVICIIVEMLRKWLFDKIYQSKIARKNRQNYQQYFIDLGIKINW